MPSFTRRTPSSTQYKPAPLGTIPSLSATTPPLYLLPTGIPSLDDLLGGGLPLGGILGITAPDRHTAWSRLISRYFLSQGLITGQKSVIIGEKEETRNVVEGSIWVDEMNKGEGSESEGEGLEDVGQGKGGTKIAWRYEKMKKFQTTIRSGSTGIGTGGSTGGRELNLMTPIPGELLDHLHKTGVQKYIDIDPFTVSTTGSSSKTSVGWGVMKKVSEDLGKMIDNLGDVALRVTIHELGSVDWGSPTSQEIHRFIHCLRGLIASKPVGITITFPSELSRTSSPEWTTQLGWSLDALIELRGFGDEPTLPPLFHPLHGLVSLPRLPTTHHLLPPSYKNSSLLGLAGSGGTGGAGENNLGFRLKRKRFVVETVHLGIEGGTGERRTEPKPELGSLVGATKATPAEPTEGVEKVKGEEDGMDLDIGGVNPTMQDTGVDRPRGPQEEKKKKKPRARVRFGGEEELGEVEVQVGNEVETQKGHTHDHAHDHAHTHATSQPGRPFVRHDRPDLYEF